MEELISVLSGVADKLDGTWKENVLIDNINDNEFVDAYNEGVKAMANQARFYIGVIITSKKIEMKQKQFGTIFDVKKEDDK